MTSLLVLVPCHNEQAVVERKLQNLAAAGWPAGGEHRVVVIDDGSTDGTAARAEEAIGRHFTGPVRASVVPGDAQPGKSGAIAHGLSERADQDLIVLTDADVLLAPDALVELAAAFDRDPRLGMASGAQDFVDDVEGEHSPAMGLYDRVTAWVRSVESRGGRLVSVHGQLLAWRADLGLAPTPGMAADDLDLMLQARAQGARIERVAAARFLEARPHDPEQRGAQALRRARAYVQFLEHARIAELSSRGGPLGRLQGWAYRTLPTAAPRLIPLLAALLVAFTGWALGARAGSGALLILLALAVSPVGRRLIALLRVIAAARRREASGGMTDRWETARH